MKKVLLGISLLVFYGACTSKKESSLDMQKDLLPVNSTSMYNSSILTDTGTVKSEGTEPVVRTYNYRKPAPRRKQVQTAQTVYNNPAPVTVPQPDNTGVVNVPVSTPGPVVTTPSAGADNGNNAGTGTEGTETPVVKKKGWSDAAKGAVIGGVGGAIAGAVINGKNRGKGAIIGGVVGAAGGYILGKKKDKRDEAANK